MEPKSPGYEKLVNEKRSPNISPAGKKRLRFKFGRMLSTGNLKASSTPASPTTPRLSPHIFESNSLESVRRSFGNTSDGCKVEGGRLAPPSPRPLSYNIRSAF
ncbi:uncharacterized protein LOC116178293 [Photinus pyralis]|uniref:uncharacterized protein LOC116178293 n=1 Tax=Photinus pyralis TaxID=7054 RepID=UPI0012674FDD|nr:uncharacterized protein LOC116178293 [Photinus pyralis]